MWTKEKRKHERIEQKHNEQSTNKKKTNKKRLNLTYARTFRSTSRDGARVCDINRLSKWIHNTMIGMFFVFFFLFIFSPSNVFFISFYIGWSCGKKRHKKKNENGLVKTCECYTFFRVKHLCVFVNECFEYFACKWILCCEKYTVTSTRSYLKCFSPATQWMWLLKYMFIAWGDWKLKTDFHLFQCWKIIYPFSKYNGILASKLWNTIPLNQFR